MTRSLLALACGTLLAVAAQAQTLHVECSGVRYSFPASTAGTMEFADGGTLTVLGRAFRLTPATAMWVDSAPVQDGTVAVTYTPEGAAVDIAGDIARYVDATVSGGHVTLTQIAEVSEATCGEITYILSGSCPDGSLLLTGSYKCTVTLAGLALTNPSGAPIDIQDGKRVALRLADGTASALADGAGSQKGCLVCKGHLEFKGKGSLTISGAASHAIYAKEYVEIKDCSVTVTSAAKDGVNCNQHFTLRGGSLAIAGAGDDGVQVSYKDAEDREADDTGMITIAGGSLTIEVTAAAAKGAKCEGPMLISGGDIRVTARGDGIWDSAKSKTKAAACLASDETITITGGTLSLTATGGGGKGLNCDGALAISGGETVIHTSGGVCAYVNGKLSNNYTGNTDRLTSDQKSSPKGIKADGDILISGGTVNVTTTGTGAEGIESKAELTIQDGTVTVTATDDAINSASHMRITGGTVTAIASGNDGLDSNGNLYISGGRVMAFGARSPECGIDANEEEGYTVIFTGGTLLAVGGNNSVPSSSSGSSQPYVSGSGTVSAGTAISLTDASGAELASFTVPSAYSPSASAGGGNRPGGTGSSSSVLITCPGLSSGSSYTLRSGTSSSSVTARLTGTGGGGWRP